MLNRCIVITLFMLLIPAVVIAADAPIQRLDVRYDPEARTIEGHLDITLAAFVDTAYFALLANLGRERNPFVSPRTLDATYPYGFEPAGLDIESVDLVRGETAESIPFRWLSMPPSLQTFSLDETVLAVDLPASSQDGSGAPTLRIRFTTHAPRTTSGDDGLTLQVRKR